MPASVSHGAMISTTGIGHEVASISNNVGTPVYEQNGYVIQAVSSTGCEGDK